MDIQKHSVEAEGLGIKFSTGTLAKQANGAVTVSHGETSLFVSACAANTVRPDQDWFPLMVDYREKFFAAGRFPGGYFKREGRPSEKEILTSRLCDRPLRPLFPKGFMNEVQIIGFLLSVDLINEPDILMVNGASAALMISDIPWEGPVGCVRVGEVNGELVLNPNNDQLFESTLDLVYVGSEKEMLMIEGSADQLPEARFIEALELAHEGVQKIIAAQRKLAELAGKPKRDFALVRPSQETIEICEKTLGSRLAAALTESGKLERQAAVEALFEEAKEAVKSAVGEDNYDESLTKMALDQIQEAAYRKNIFDGKRADGRGAEDLRAIECNAGIIPRVHGSAMFQRGETQAIALTTLGTARDAQDLDALTGGAVSKSFTLHYNFPPFSVGETGRFGFTSRREIGHGALAERSLLPVIPQEEDFGYSIRVVSEIMESNGSSSMASICGGCLSLMDAGVPIIAPVAGISAGLVTEMDDAGNIAKHIVLTDIIGAEDHFGDMDFKVAGTRKGITGFQLDLKIKGLPFDIAKEAIARVTEARYKIIDLMEAELPTHREELKDSAPRVHQMKIDPDKIGALIGPGGKNIKRITEVTGAQINIDEDNSGKVSIYSNDGESLKLAIEEVMNITREIEVGKTYRGIVQSIKEFGVFVQCIPGKDGLVHVSELADFRVDKPEDVCGVGDELLVQCIGIDDKGRVKLSRKAALCEAQGIPYTPPAPRASNGGDRGRGRGGRSGDRSRSGGDRERSRSRA